MYHKTYKFGNNYGASVVCHAGSYGGDMGLFEVAVLDINGNVVYDSPVPVANNIIGYLDFDGVAKVLQKIQALPKKTDI